MAFANRACSNHQKVLVLRAGLCLVWDKTSTPPHLDSFTSSNSRSFVVGGIMGTCLEMRTYFSSYSYRKLSRATSGIFAAEGQLWPTAVVVVYSLNHIWLFETQGLQHARLPCASLLPRVCLNSCPLSRWCHPTISSSAVPFSSCLQSFPALGSFPMSRLFTSGGQNIGASASTSVLPMNIQGLFPLGLIGLISLQSKGLSSLL